MYAHVDGMFANDKGFNNKPSLFFFFFEYFYPRRDHSTKTDLPGKAFFFLNKGPSGSHLRGKKGLLYLKGNAPPSGTLVGGSLIARCEGLICGLSTKAPTKLN